MTYIFFFVFCKIPSQNVGNIEKIQWINRTWVWEEMVSVRSCRKARVYCLNFTKYRVTYFLAATRESVSILRICSYPHWVEMENRFLRRSLKCFSSPLNPFFLSPFTICVRARCVLDNNICILSCVVALGSPNPADAGDRVDGSSTVAPSNTISERHLWYVASRNTSQPTSSRCLDVAHSVRICKVNDKILPSW